MAAAANFHIGRLSIFCCYAARLCFAFAELIWYAKFVFERIERESWSLNAARGSSDFSSYDAINKYPLLLFGLKRGILTLFGATTFLSIGIIYRNHPWALWLGVLLLWEFVFRFLLYLCWSILPRVSCIRICIERAKETAFPKFMAEIMKAREPLHASHERVPFQEEAAQPFNDSSAKTVWRSYTWAFRSVFMSTRQVVKPVQKRRPELIYHK